MKSIVVKEDMICPLTNQHCDDECCTVGSICNISGSELSDMDCKPTEEVSNETRMNLKETLLTHYLLAIEMVKDAENWYLIIHLMEVDYGVCSCAQHVFDEDIRGEEWVVKYSVNGYFWGMIPRNVATKKEVLDCLQVRVDNLIKEIYEPG